MRTLIGFFLPSTRPPEWPEAVRDGLILALLALSGEAAIWTGVTIAGGEVSSFLLCLAIGLMALIGFTITGSLVHTGRARHQAVIGILFWLSCLSAVVLFRADDGLMFGLIPLILFTGWLGSILAAAITPRPAEPPPLPVSTPSPQPPPLPSLY